MAKTVKLVTDKDFSSLFSLDNGTVDIAQTKLKELIREVASEVKEYEL